MNRYRIPPRRRRPKRKWQPITLLQTVRAVMAKTGDPEATLVLAFVALRGGANEAQLAQDLREWEPQFGPATEANVLAWARNHPKANANVRPLNQ